MSPAAVPPPEDRPGAALARFVAARGYPVFEADGVLWAKFGRTFYQSLPFQTLVDPDLPALRRALRAVRGLAASYPTVTRPGLRSGLHTCSPRDYSLEAVEPGHRRQVRRGLRVAEIRPMDPDELLALGLELNLQTLARQERFDPEFGEPARWRRFVAATRACREVALTGAFVDGLLSAYWVSVRDGAWLHLVFKMARTEHLIHRAAVALDFRVITDAAEDPTIEAVSNSFVTGWRHGESLDRYKRSMGFVVRPHRNAIEFHPALRPFLTNRVAVKTAELLTRAHPGNARLELIANMITGTRSRTDDLRPGAGAAER